MSTRSARILDIDYGYFDHESAGKLKRIRDLDQIILIFRTDPTAVWVTTDMTFLSQLGKARAYPLFTISIFINDAKWPLILYLSRQALH